VLTLAVFIIGFFPNVHKSNPAMGMGFGVGFFLMLASLLFYTLNAHLKKKDDYDAIIRDFRMNKLILLIGILVAVFYFIFCYIPMYGIIIGFKDFSALKGILASEWVGFRHLENFFTGIYFNRTVKNTLILNIYQLIFGFPAPILLALLLNEIKVKAFKRTVQTITYLPHFVSLVVICGIVVDFFSLNGLFNDLISLFGLERSMFLQDPNAYRPIYVGSGIWASIGWGSIIYLAALSGINQELYEAVAIEGAGRFRQFIHVTLPGITPMIVIMFILQIGSLMSEGADKAILLANPLTWETSDIISFYTYRRGLVEGDFSYSAAVGLFNTAINLVLLVSANSISRRVGETSLW
jgi:putative aldouronate transport system permease protein